MVDSRPKPLCGICANPLKTRGGVFAPVFRDRHFGKICGDCRRANADLQAAMASLGYGPCLDTEPGEPPQSNRRRR
jgi:hypothetical protein